MIRGRVRVQAVSVKYTALGSRLYEYTALQRVIEAFYTRRPTAHDGASANTLVWSQSHINPTFTRCYVCTRTITVFLITEHLAGHFDTLPPEVRSILALSNNKVSLHPWRDQLWSLFRE